MCPEEQQHKLALIMDFASRNSSQNSSQNSFQNSSQNKETEIPDPYFGNDAGFQRVLELLGDATEGLLNHIVLSHFPEMTIP